MSEALVAREHLQKFYNAAEKTMRAHERDISLNAMKALVKRNPNPRPSFISALTQDREVAVIAEFKRRSPSRGDIVPPGTPVAPKVQAYEAGGASALSVLTNGEFFGGSIEDVSEAATHSSLSILRKDFMAYPYQVYEAAANGASCILAIVAGLDDKPLVELRAHADAIEVDTMYEVHNEEELDRAMERDPKVIGINNRSLVTFEEDITVARELIRQVPNDIPVVAESAYQLTTEHWMELESIGATAVLAGTAPMKSKNPARDIHDWRNSSVIL